MSTDVSKIALGVATGIIIAVVVLGVALSELSALRDAVSAFGGSLHEWQRNRSIKESKEQARLIEEMDLQGRDERTLAAFQSCREAVATRLAADAPLELGDLDRHRDLALQMERSPWRYSFAAVVKTASERTVGYSCMAEDTGAGYEAISLSITRF